MTDIDQDKLPVFPAVAGNARSDLVELVKKSSVSLALKIAGGLVAFVTTLVAGRLLGTAGSGLFFLSLAVVTITAAIARLGLDQAVTRFVSEARIREDWSGINGMYLRSVLTILITSSSFTAILYFSAIPICRIVFEKPNLIPVLQWMSLSIIGFALTWIHAHFFQGLEEIKRFQVFQNLGLTTCFLLILGFSVFLDETNGDTPETFGKCFFLASLIAAISAHLFWRLKHPWFAWSASGDAWQSMLPTLLPFFGIVTLQILSNWLPQIVLGVLCSAEEVGVYNAAFRVANLTSLVLLGVNSVVFPKFAVLYAAGEIHRLRTLAQSSSRIMILGSLPFLGLLLALPATILGFFGAGFESGAVALQILAVGQLVNVATGSVGGLLNMTGHQAASLTCGIISFVAMLTLAFALTPSLGSNGAAVAQSSSLILNMALLSYCCFRHLGFAPMSLYPFRGMD